MLELVAGQQASDAFILSGVAVVVVVAIAGVVLAIRQPKVFVVLLVGGGGVCVILAARSLSTRRVAVSERPAVVVTRVTDGSFVSVPTRPDDAWPLQAQWRAESHPTRKRAVEALAVQVARELREGFADCSRLTVAVTDEALAGELMLSFRAAAPGLQLSGAADDPQSNFIAALLAQPEIKRLANGLVGSAVEEWRSRRRSKRSDEETVSQQPGARTQPAAPPTDSAHLVVAIIRAAQAAGQGKAARLEVESLAVGDADSLHARLAYPTLTGRPVTRQFLLCHENHDWVLTGRDTNDDNAAVFIGRSDPEPTLSAAQKSAQAHIRARVDARLRDRVGRTARLTGIERWAGRNAPAVSLTIADEYVQVFDRDTGPLFRVARRTEPVNLAHAARVVTITAQAGQRTLRSQIIGLFVLLGLTYLGYCILDASTRGHFTSRWRVVSAAAFVAMAAILVLFIE